MLQVGSSSFWNASLALDPALFGLLGINMRIFQSAISWALALFLIFMFVQATFHPLPGPPPGQVKFLDPTGENILFQTLAERSRYPIFEPTGRFVTGILETIAALLLFLPISRRLGAFVSALILFGAVGLHSSPWLGRDVPISLLPGETATDGGAQFSLAIAMLVASLLIIVIHPGRRRDY